MRHFLQILKWDNNISCLLIAYVYLMIFTKIMFIKIPALLRIFNDIVIYFKQLLIVFHITNQEIHDPFPQALLLSLWKIVSRPNTIKTTTIISDFSFSR